MSSPGYPLVASNSHGFRKLFVDAALPQIKKYHCSPSSIIVLVSFATHSSSMQQNSGPTTPCPVAQISFDLSITKSKQQNAAKKSSHCMFSPNKVEPKLNDRSLKACTSFLGAASGATQPAEKTPESLLEATTPRGSHLVELAIGQTYIYMYN